MCYALKSTQNSDTLSGAYSLFVNQCDQEPAHLTTIPKDRTSKILKRNLIYLSIFDHDALRYD